MEYGEAKKKIKKFILKRFLPEGYDLQDDELLFSGGIIDSLGMIELISLLEENFAININSSEISMDNFSTINKIAEVITGKIKNND